MATADNSLSQYDPSQVPDGSNYRVALVVSEWNNKITEALFQGAKTTLLSHNVADNNIVRNIIKESPKMAPAFTSVA